MKTIIMNTDEVRGILNGLKTMARAVINPQPTYWNDGECVYDKDSVVGPELYNPICVDKDGDQYPGKEIYGIYSDDGEYGCKAPYKPGDVLWVRETWGDYGGQTGHYIYRADYPLSAKGYWHEKEHINWCDFPKWNSPVTMPREAARLFLRVKDVRVERLKSIPEDDVVREGFYDEYDLKTDIVCPDGRRFRAAWDARNAKRGYGWDTNPWVWVIKFEECNTH